MVEDNVVMNASATLNKIIFTYFLKSMHSILQSTSHQKSPVLSVEDGSTLIAKIPTKKQSVSWSNS